MTLQPNAQNGGHFALRSLRLVTIYGQSDQVWLQEDPFSKEEYMKPLGTLRLQ